MGGGEAMKIKIEGMQPLTVSWVKSTFSDMRDLIHNSTPNIYTRNGKQIAEFSSDYNLAVNKFHNFSFAPNFRESFSLSMLQDILRNCVDKAFRLDMLNRVEKIMLAEIEADEQTFRELSATTNIYCYFEQSIYDVSDNWNFWYNPLGNTQFCEHLLLPYLYEDAFLDFNSKRERLAYLALYALLKEKSIIAYRFLRSLLKSGVKPPMISHWEFYLRDYYYAIGGERLCREALFYIGNEWEQLCFEILQEKCTEVVRHPRLLNYSIPDIAVGTIQKNSAGDILHIDRIIECKKSVYFNVVDNEAADNYTPYCDCLEFWVLEKANNPYFTYPNSEKMKYRFACDLLDSPEINENHKAKIRRLQDISNNMQIVKNPKSIDELCYAIDLFLRVLSSNVQMKKQPVQEQPPKTVVRQYQMDGTFVREFATAKLAAAEIGVGADTITNVTSGRRNSAKGFLWRKCAADSPIENIVPSTTTLDLEGKLIYQVDQNGEVVATFDSMRKAEKISGVNRHSISDALKGIQKTAGGFTWVLGDKTLD